MSDLVSLLERRLTKPRQTLMQLAVLTPKKRIY